MQYRKIILANGIYLHVLVIVIAICFLWIPEYLPMIDLPQHAAQVSLFIAMLEGHSSFSDIVEVNYFTPYWIGYGPLAVLALVFEITVAVKLFISIVFICFYISVYFFFKSINTPVELAILALPSFFGFSFEWGFLTFIAAVPVGLFYLSFILNNLDRSDTLSVAIRLVLFGSFLFLSHALVFVFSVAIGFFIQVANKLKNGSLSIFPDIFPYLIFLLLLATFILRADPLLDLFSYGDDFFIFSSGGNRVLELFGFPWSMIPENKSYLFSTVLLALPFALGYTPSQRIIKYLPLIVFLVLWFSLPHYFNKVFFIYQRFSLFTFVFYLAIFELKTDRNQSILFSARYFLLPLIVLFFLQRPFLDFYLFGREAEEFKYFIEKTDKNKRVLSLVFDKQSSYLSNPFVYLHFPLWYQAEKSGFVDFNFAWFSPQIVRFKAKGAPEVKPSFEWSPHTLNELADCDVYDSIIVKSLRTDLPKNIYFGGCDFIYTAGNGSWFFYNKSLKLH